MSLLTARAEKDIMASLPFQSALVFDGETTSETHYLVFFNIFQALNDMGYYMAYLALYPLEDKTREDSDEQILFRSYSFSVFRE